MHDKPNGDNMILDATAGNRIIWKNKNPDSIIFIDIEKQLERKPTLFADNRLLPFKDGVFHTILFDPPHAWSFDSIFYGIPDAETYHKNHPNDNRQAPAYYGMNLYKSKTSLLKAIYSAQEEFLRVLSDDGLLWFNWSELRIELRKVLVLFEEWTELIRLRVKSPNQQLSECANYWVAFAKNRFPYKQTKLMSKMVTT